VNHPHPRREFGLVPPEVAGRTSRFEFLQGLLDASHPMPPFSEVAEVWPISAEVERVVFEASLSARFYHPMGLIGAAPRGAAPWLWACHVAHGSRSTTRSTLGMMDAPLAASSRRSSSATGTIASSLELENPASYLAVKRIPPKWDWVVPTPAARSRSKAGPR
jgi:hypothetical protein